MDYEFYKPEGNGGSDGYVGWASFTLNDEKQAKKRFSGFFTAVFIYLIISNVLVLAAQAIIMLIGGESAVEFLNNTPLIIILINALAMYAIAFPIFWLLTRKMRFIRRNKRKMKAGEFFSLFCIAEAGMVFGSIVGNFISEFISIILGAENSNSTIDLVSSAPIWAVIIFVVVLGPIVEELIFRKMLMDRLGKYGDRIAIIVSGVAFGLFHGNLYQLFYATIVGIIFAYIYSRTGNIVYSIVMHGIVNFLGSVVPMLMAEHFNVIDEILPALEAGTLENPEQYAQSLALISLYSFTLYGIAAVGIFFAIRNRRGFFVSDRCEVLIPKERRAGVIMGNVGAVLFLVLSAVTIVFDVISPLITNILGGA